MIRTLLQTEAIKCEQCERVAKWQCKPSMQQREWLFVCDRHGGTDAAAKATIEKQKSYHTGGWNPHGDLYAMRKQVWPSS